MGKSNSNHIRLFNRIAFGYRWFFKYQLKIYRKLLKVSIEKIKLSKKSQILDVGCGTGAFGMAFKELGFDVIGIDAAEKMVKLANKKFQSFQADILDILPFSDNSFDLVIAANVIHGFSKPDRIKIYEELHRISKGKILIHDYNSRRKLGTSIIEWVEDGFYFEFIKDFPSEFTERYGNFEIIASTNQNSWYFFEIEGKLNI